ncbi:MULTISPECIES: hypothetical protein [Streptomyces]|uniref:hypothetical protein n=1 Tax=Streptomyces TaxID=1883 RepID=UPI00135F1629|nr:MULTISPECIES: hypothetical protein [Streptomyces]MDN5385005.1 hypothetical protein [Streptomyces sp. LB8]
MVSSAARAVSAFARAFLSDARRASTFNCMVSSGLRGAPAAEEASEEAASPD